MREHVEPDPTPEEIQSALQQSILRDYPNPDRKSCIGAGALRQVAQERLPHKHEHWVHISRCSPCYREFLDVRKQFRGEGRIGHPPRKTMTSWLVLIAIV